MRTCTREQIREMDRVAIEEYGIPGIALMENAGRAVADAAVEMLGDPAGKRVVIFCGKGNNGGDGFVAARHLHNRGVAVEVILACSPEQIHPKSDAEVNLGILGKMRVSMRVATDRESELLAGALAGKADLIIDALLGTGLSGDVEEPYLCLIRLINAQDKPVLSVDIPSGLETDTGRVLRAAVRAARTVTFVLPKVGFELGDGPSHTGKVIVADIGMPKEIVEKLSPRLSTAT